MIIAMGQLLRAMEQRVRLELRELDLTPPDVEILAWLDARPGIAGANVAVRSGRSRQSLQRSLEHLERRGLVLRYDSVISRRTEGWALTPLGERKLETAVRVLRRMESEFAYAADFEPRRFLFFLTTAVNVARGNAVHRRSPDEVHVVDIPPPPRTPEWDL